MDYALAGLFCGLAAATHYTAGAVAVGILVAHLEARHCENQSLIAGLLDRRIYVAGAVTIATFLCADPYSLLDWNQTGQDYIFLRNNYRMWNGGHSPAGYGWPWLLFRAMPAGFGIELEVFLLAALVWTTFRPRPGTFALLAFIVVCFLSLTGGHPQLEFRYLVNPLLAMALLGGVLATDLIARARSTLGTVPGISLIALGGILLIVPSLARDVQLNHLLSQTDTRTLAREWMVANIPAASQVIMIDGETYGKPKVAGRYQLISVHNVPELRAATESAKWVVSDSFPPLSLWSKGASRRESAVLDSQATLEFDSDPMKAGAEEPVFDPNDAFFVPFKHITSMIRPGPRIRIWKIAAPPTMRRKRLFPLRPDSHLPNT
jgi:hypothetical protein